jgi:hypothetical protein
MVVLIFFFKSGEVGLLLVGPVDWGGMGGRRVRG